MINSEFQVHIMHFGCCMNKRNLNIQNSCLGHSPSGVSRIAVVCFARCFPSKATPSIKTRYIADLNLGFH